MEMRYPFPIASRLAPRVEATLGSPLVDDQPIMNAVNYRVVSRVVWTNRALVSSNTDTNRTCVLAVVDVVNTRLHWSTSSLQWTLQSTVGVYGVARTNRKKVSRNADPNTSDITAVEGNILRSLQPCFQCQNMYVPSQRVNGGIRTQSLPHPRSVAHQGGRKFEHQSTAKRSLGAVRARSRISQLNEISYQLGEGTGGKKWKRQVLRTAPTWIYNCAGREADENAILSRGKLQTFLPQQNSHGCAVFIRLLSNTTSQEHDSEGAMIFGTDYFLDYYLNPNCLNPLRTSGERSDQREEDLRLRASAQRRARNSQLYVPIHETLSSPACFEFSSLLCAEAMVAERLPRLPATETIRARSPAGSLRIFACGNRAGRYRWSAGFLGDLPLPRRHIPTLLHTHLNHPHQALKT
ncbi:hypothetical protein PR048_033395 [Dryococelus australis]|uniref:Uncharacterized protein n=1 Tax=Dryococelus australis TaxID=614101 RepID=A0ABQ9G399_9NEOP|nr:hypothetical protein PR048_033395 [Dryococelus australis]